MAFPLLTNPKQNFYKNRRKQVRQIVLHVTAGLQDLDMQGSDHSAENTNRYGATTTRSASWHACVDTDSIADALPDSYTAYHCVGYNSGTLGLEISNKDARWDNKPALWIEATLLNAAKKCWEWERKYDIPRRLLTKAQVDAGMMGYTYHSFLDPARRSDPGTSFPWARFVVILGFLDRGSAVDPVEYNEVTELQRIVHVKQDGRWGNGTDLKARKLRTAAQTYAGGGLWKPDPINSIKEIQQTIGSEYDGIWGPKSQASLVWWVKLFQKNFKLPPTGVWDASTEHAFHVNRAKYHNKF